jgi:hypothetical protein
MKIETTMTVTGIEHEIADEIQEAISQALVGHRYDPYTATYDLYKHISCDNHGHPRELTFTIILDADYEG